MTTLNRLRALRLAWPTLPPAARRELIVGHFNVYAAAVRLARRERRAGK